MAIKPKVINEFGFNPEFLRDAKNVEYTVGNPVLDGSQFSKETTVKAGTAIRRDKNSGLYIVVADGDTDIVAGVLTANGVVAQPKENIEVPAVRKASVREERLSNVTDAFKEAVKGRIVFDI